ncbi:DUF262 domain-containing protein [Sphingobacterium mizutaii]|uniref:DUF262 domain-containing protein n=1 Tax=Sphingobacterium mizutaii TaxID=1010 RepID=UPI001BE45A16|nr:DUF262 domain-containing protein [Sphingobacterium mizutaii]
MAEEQIVEKQKIVDFDIKEFTIELLISKYLTGLESDDNDIFIPSYQRNFVWDADRQSKFIESVLLGLPIPYIFSADTDGRLEIVDGSQRLRTLEAFYSDKLILKNLEILDTLNGFKYSNLIKSRQRKFLNSTIRMIALSDKSDEDVRFMMFERINTGSAILKDMEKRKGIFGGKFMDFVYNECSKHPIFIRNTKFTERLEKRGEPQELIIRFFAYSDSYEMVKTGVNEFLNQFVDSKNKSFDKERYKKEFDNMLKFVDKYFPDGFIKNRTSSKTPRVRFDAISVGVNLALRENPNLKPKDLSWLNGKNFNELITKGGQNAPKAIKERIEFVYKKLINE